MQYTHAAASAGQWIIDSCSLADPATISAQVPLGYERYVRILHPAYDEFDRPVRWSAVAASRGRILQPSDLFEDIAGLDSAGNPLDEDSWVDSDLPVEALPAAQWQALAGHLAAAADQAAAGQPIYAGLWAGYAFIEGGERIQIEMEDDPALDEAGNQAARAAALAEAQKPAFGPEVLEAEQLQLGGGYRNYHLFEVDAEFLAEPLWAVTADGQQRQLPSLAFPAGHDWMASTEPYDDSTIVGGSAQLIEAILADARLEAIEVGQFTRIGHSA